MTWQKETAIKARTAQTIIENGRDLMEVKERLEHGQFQKWIEANFPWSVKTARQMMKAADVFSKQTNSSVLNFAKETLFLLAQDSTPDTAREEAIDRAEQGEKFTHKQAKELVEAHKAIDEERKRVGSLEPRVMSDAISTCYGSAFIKKFLCNPHGFPR